MMTLEEQERRAYAGGDVQCAALLVRAIDGDEEQAERMQWLEDENARLQRDSDELAEMKALA